MNEIITAEEDGIVSLKFDSFGIHGELAIFYDQDGEGRRETKLKSRWVTDQDAIIVSYCSPDRGLQDYALLRPEEILEMIRFLSSAYVRLSETRRERK